MSSQVSRLRQALEQRFPDAMPLLYRTTESVATGVAELDRILPGGGLPRGRLVVWRSGGGARAVLWSACEQVVSRGERAAWVDASGVVSVASVSGGSGWCGGGRSGVSNGRGERAPLLVHPSGSVEALACAEDLLRSGGFGLVVLVGVLDPPESVGVRLSRAAGAGGGAFVQVGGAPPVAGLRLSSRIVPAAYRWLWDAFGGVAEVESVGVEVEVAGLGLSARTEFRMRVMPYEVRMSLDAGLVDRRGAGR